MFYLHSYENLALYILIIPVWCHNQTETLEYYFGTKTPYRSVANQNDSKLEFNGCEPSRIWMLVRHGTRNPNAKLVRKMNVRLSEIRELILNGNLEDMPLKTFFQQWKPSISEEDMKKLTHEGEEEMLQLAKRMKNRFPTLFPVVFSNSSYQFKFTATQRTEESAKYFAAGLFGNVNVNNVWFPQPSHKDPILRFYKLCNKWRQKVKKNPAAVEEKNKFESSTIMKDTLQQVQKTLGFTDQLSFEDLHLLYMTCAFETAWSQQVKSPWCMAFSTESLKVMEFYEDLKYYWVDGYGHEITYKQACPAFGSMINFLQNENPELKAIVYFTHSGTILKMLAHLGLYKEPEHLRHLIQNNNRVWRVGKINAFGSNLAFVSYKCGERKKVLFLHQEKIVPLPSCTKEELCDLDQVIKHYDESVNSCNFNEMCENSPAPAT